MAKKKEYKLIKGFECINIKSLCDYYDLDPDEIYFDIECGCIVDKDGNVFQDSDTYKW